MIPHHSVCFLTLALCWTAVTSRADPPETMQEHRRWARQAKDPQVRVTRLEGFWKKYLPKAEGGTNPEISEYEDGFHVLSVAGCAWEMVRAYIEANRPQDALRMLDWLQMYDSKSQLINKPVN